jgi:hypothetical protein
MALPRRPTGRGAQLASAQAHPGRPRGCHSAPLPENRDPDDAAVDPAGPDGRAVLIASEFGPCDLGGADTDEFLAAASRVAEELWHDDPHDVIHLLAESRANGSRANQSRS